MRINKIPFFLWLTQRRDDLTLDLVNQKVISKELGESSIQKVPIFLIVLMKYVPFVLLSYFFFIPRNLFEVGLMFIALFLALFLFALVKYELIFKSIILTFCVVSFYLIFKYDSYAVHLSTALTLFVQIVLVLILLYDILYLKGYKNWYFLSSFKLPIDIKVAEKKEKKLLFFWKKNIGFNVKRQVYLAGYFLKVENENVN